MARYVKPDEYAAHRNAILDASLRLIHEKGYDGMTIEDVLTALQISKGALYHYFDSKEALLDGIVTAMGESGSAALRVVVERPNLTAVERMRAYFDVSTAWKSAHITEVNMSVRLWRHENNARLRQRMSQESMRTTTPLLETIIRQGCHEGVFDTAYPHEAAIILTGMGLHLADAIIDAVAADGTGMPDSSGPQAAGVIAAYTDAFERVLGAQPGSFAAQN